MIKNKEIFDPGEENSADKFSGNAFACFNTVLFLGFEVFLVFVLFGGGKAGQQKDLILLMAGTLIVYLLIGFQMFYFKVSSGYLIVKRC